MTAQAPEKLTNDYPGLDFAGLKLYRVITEFSSSERRGKPYPFRHRAKEPSGTVSTAMWRGHIACYRLTAEGRLQLEGFEYPPRDDVAGERVSETLQGEFWLVLGDSFFGSRTYVPFRNGIVVTDRAQWLRDERPNTSLERTRDR
jgi:hypothetical protein